MNIDVATLFDAHTYQQSGRCPWTFFAYPTSLAEDSGFPPDEKAVWVLGELQRRGIQVGIWINGIAEDTTYFACPYEERERLNEVLAALSANQEIEKDFLASRSEELFSRLAGS